MFCGVDCWREVGGGGGGRHRVLKARKKRKIKPIGDRQYQALDQDQDQDRH